MALDFILRNCRVVGREDTLTDIGVSGEKIAAIEANLASDARSEDANGCLVLPGFVETHIHLDKSCLLERCSAHGSLSEAIAEVASIKKGFTEQDVYDRGRRTLEKSILNGTTHMRTHVEVDPRVGLRSFNAIQQLKRDYAWAIDLEICVFPQEGLLNDPGTDELLVEACRNGASLIGGVPLHRQRSERANRAHFRVGARIRSRHRFSSRFRPEPSLDASRRSLPADCRASLRRACCHRSCHEIVVATGGCFCCRRQKIKRCRRCGHGLAGNRSVSDGPRS